MGVLRLGDSPASGAGSWPPLQPSTDRDEADAPKLERANRRYQKEDHSKKGEDGRYALKRKGIEICRLYNANKFGSTKAQGYCKASRSHQCSVCLGPHQALACPKANCN